MKVIEKRVFSRLLSYVLAVALMAGLMPGVVAKAVSYSENALANHIGLGNGDTILLSEGTSPIYFKANTEYKYSMTEKNARNTTNTYGIIRRTESQNMVYYMEGYFGDENGNPSDSGSMVPLISIPKNDDKGVIKTISGNGTQSDPYVFGGESNSQGDPEEDAFKAEKETQKKAADGLLKSDDSEACKKLVEDAKKTIDETKYDKSKDLDANKKVLADIVTKLEKDLEEQRKKDLEEQRKKGAETAAEDPDTVVHPDGSKTVTEVKTSGNNTEITVTDYNKDGSQLAQYIYNGASGENLDLRTINYSGKNIVIPDTVTGGGKTYKVTRLRKNFMKKCKKARKVDVGENVNRIDKGAFNGGKKVRYITIRGKLKKVGAGAFKALKKGTIKFKTSKKVYRHNVKLVEKSGLNPNIKVKRIKKK
ncbi:cell envelope integrity protein TolA [Butyrivibrio sp. FC2001]|uniref:cell envelope integrity protein TolA n=1 Tax=Butyrivibrio sp. FC2001 TaxID=1280671 RepID=UPI0003F9159C|nr:cell envelope integrity protein TolA [Butyrivibrio sp. FC2001]